MKLGTKDLRSSVVSHHVRKHDIRDIVLVLRTSQGVGDIVLPIAKGVKGEYYVESERMRWRCCEPVPV
ncbi:hypothetical protein P171DRAFT_435539, partial [Karstenula rhodostoma CBS 690.94]